MILRGLHLEHWRCIPRLDLDGLPEGILVLHGPNRTGKSSLVRALRACLFDADHNTGGKEFEKNRPWDGSGPPRVAIEFNTGGLDYRLTKVFSRKVDGTALLEKKAGDRWEKIEDAPKEASRKVRELFGAEKSSAGLNQLLWVEQGDIGLPEAAKLDSSLEKQLVQVLGVLVTGRDLAFKQALDKRYSEWFTDKGASRKNSPIPFLEQQREEKQLACAEERKKLEQWEAAILRQETCEDEVPQRRSEEQAAAREYKAIEEERERSRERRILFQRVEAEHTAACQALEHAEKKLASFTEAQERTAGEEGHVAAAAEKVQIATLERNRLAPVKNEKDAELAASRKMEEEHRRDRDEIDDLRALLNLATKRVEGEERLDTAKKLEEAIIDLETQLSQETAADETTLSQLRNNRDQARRLRARLEAAELFLSMTLQRDIRVQLSLDGKPGQCLDFVTEEKRTWPVRQRAHLEIPDFGTIDLARSHEDLNLEAAANELAKLDRDYQDSVRSFREDPADETCLDRLTERRLRRASLVKRLKEVRKDLHDRAPAGSGALATDLANLVDKRNTILERRSDLREWQPSQEEIDHKEIQFKARLEELEKTRKQWEADATKAGQLLQEAENHLQQARVHLAGAAATAQASAQEVERLGNEAALREARDQANKARAEAESRLRENQLTDEEKTIDQRIAAARAGWDARKQRLTDLVLELRDLRLILLGNEGLHQRVANAEAAVQEIEKTLARATLDAAAHHRLRQLFEECRESQVQRVMGPIADRVLSWARKIGLDEYREVRFGDRFLPEGIVREAGPVDAPIYFEDESYGTGEQLGLLVRLALGGVLAKDEPGVAILDDPLAHADLVKHRRILDILRLAAEGNTAWSPPAGRLQIIILTCHPDRFDFLPGARHINLAQLIGK